MDFFNKAKDSFAAAGKGFSQKANDVSGIARVTMKMKEEEKQLQSSIHELGLQIYNQYNEEAKKMCPELTGQIKELYAALERDRIELAYLKGKKVCPNCGTELSSELQCCTTCGINVENVVNPLTIERSCENCGNTLPEGAKFCLHCGTKVE